MARQRRADLLEARRRRAADVVAGRGGSERLAGVVEATLLLAALDERTRTRRRFDDRAAQVTLYAALAAELPPRARSPPLRRGERAAGGDAESLLRIAARASGGPRTRLALRAVAGFERQRGRGIDPLLRALGGIPWLEPRARRHAIGRVVPRLVRHDDDRVPVALGELARTLPRSAARELIELTEQGARAGVVRPFLAARLAATERRACAAELARRYAAGESPSRCARAARALVRHLAAGEARALVEALAAERVTLVDALAVRLAELSHLGEADALLEELRAAHVLEGRARRDARCRLLAVRPARARPRAFTALLEEAAAHGDRELVTRNTAILTAAVGSAALVRAEARGGLAADTLVSIARHAEGSIRRRLAARLVRRDADPDTKLSWVTRDREGTPLTDVLSVRDARILVIDLIEASALQGARGDVLAGWGGCSLAALAPLIARIDRHACGAVAEAAASATARTGP